MGVAEQIHAADYELITANGTTRTKATYLERRSFQVA
jgi:hypothetical protein